MAVEKLPVNASVQFSVQTGIDGDGNPVFARRTYNRVKPTADFADVYTVTEGITELQIYPLASIQLSEQSQLMDDGL